MMAAIASPASSTATGLHRPTSPATTDGKPKMPLPIMQFTTSATMLQRPMARTSCGGVLCESPCGIVLLYHKREHRVRYCYATHLECSVTGERHDIARVQGAVEAGPANLGRWRELLPLPDPRHAVSLGEVETPLIELTNSARPAGF